MLITDIFPINNKALPELFAYEINASGNRTSIAGKLAYRLKKRFKGHWSSSGSRIISDMKLDESQIKEFLSDLWKSKDLLYGTLASLSLMNNWSFSAFDIATFTARGIMSDYDGAIYGLLSSNSVDISGGAGIEKIHEFRGWVVDGTPSVSISISSKIFLKRSLDYYMKEGLNPIGHYVAVHHQTLKGEVVRIIGTLKEHRDRLSSLAQDDNTLRLLEITPDEMPVVTVISGRNPYDYPVNLLHIVLTLQNADQFRVSTSEISRNSKMSPSSRRRLVERVKKAVLEGKSEEFKLLKDEFNSENNPISFPKYYSLPFSESVTVGNGYSCGFESRQLMNQMRLHGLHSYSKALKGRNIHMSVLKPQDFNEEARLITLLEKVNDQIGRLGFRLTVFEPRSYRYDRADMEVALNKALEREPDIVMFVLPGSINDEGDLDDVDFYHTFKGLSISRGVAGQAVNIDTLSKPFAVTNIILGILGKTGNIPYILSKGLDFCDVVVGLDIARERKEKLPGSKNAAAIARVYFNNGEFMRYTIHDAPIEGETVPPDVLKNLFPINEFKGKRVVIHRDGYFRGPEKRTLVDWGKSIGAKFSLVEVIKREAPRIYSVEEHNTKAPLKGSVFRLDSDEAFVISSPPPFPGSTPRPLRIKNYGPITLEQAIQSVLSLTQLHYGSLNAPRLPITIHYSDKIAYFALRGIKPLKLTGDIPFWL